MEESILGPGVQAEAVTFSDGSKGICILNSKLNICLMLGGVEAGALFGSMKEWGFK